MSFARGHAMWRMRRFPIRIVVPLCALLLSATASAAPPSARFERIAKEPTAARECRRPARRAKGRDLGKIWRGEPVRVDLHAAMYRTENGCPVPAILRRGTGG